MALMQKPPDLYYITGHRALQICLREGPVGTPAGIKRPLKAFSLNKNAEARMDTMKWVLFMVSRESVCLREEREKKLGKEMGSVQRRLRLLDPSLVPLSHIPGIELTPKTICWKYWKSRKHRKAWVKRGTEFWVIWICCTPTNKFLTSTSAMMEHLLTT